MTSKKWTVSYTPLRTSPNGAKLMDIPFGAIVVPTGEIQQIEEQGKIAAWEQVHYRGRTAWVHSAYVEELTETFPDYEVNIPTATTDETDAAQYMVLNGDVKYNMCGQLCVAFIGGDDILTFINKWKEVSPVYYTWATAGNKDEPTGMDALASMLKVYGYKTNTEQCFSFINGMTDPVLGIRLSPGRFQKLLENHFLIAAVKIDAVTGKLRGQGVGHWVVLDKVTPNGVNSGRVEIYNPFPNKRQEYSYDEFVASCGSPYWLGLWVKRNLT